MVEFSEADNRFMARAIELAKRGLFTTHPNPRVGCVIVKNGEIIGEGWHQRAGRPHAEINAMAGVDAGFLQGSVVYVTLEPCSHTGRTPPCSQALIRVGVKHVIAAMQDPNPLVAGSGIAQLKAAGIDTAHGLMQQAARNLNPGFIKRMEQGAPWVSVKLAMSLDGRTAMASGESKWITSPSARHDVQFLRAKASAILTGQGTVLADNPSLNVRLDAAQLGIESEVRQPLRVVLDPDLAMPDNALMLGLPGETLIYAGSTCDKQKKALLQARGAEVIELENTSMADLPLKTIMQDLARREINEIHVEAGATLCGALLQQQYVDELVIYVAPHLMGSEGRGLLNLPGLRQMRDRIPLKIEDIRAIGEDWRIIARPQPDPER